MSDKKTEKTKSKKKIILKVISVFLAFLVLGYLNAIAVNSKRPAVIDGGVAMHDYLESLEDKN